MGFKVVLRTVDWNSHLDVCLKMVGYVGQEMLDEYKDVKGSDDDDEVAIYIHEGEHIGTKRKVRYTKGK